MGNSSSSEKGSSDEETFEWLPRRAACVASVRHGWSAESLTTGAAEQNEPSSWQIRHAKVLVVRRGCAVPLTINLPHWSGAGRDDMRAEVRLLPRDDTDLPAVIVPRGSNRLAETSQDPGCVVVVNVERTGRRGRTGTSEARVKVFVPLSTPVGRYSLSVVCSSQSSDELVRTELDESILLVYNAWNKSEGVHSRSEQLLSEYLQSEGGHVCLGTRRQPLIASWNFGQLNWSVCQLATHLLTKMTKVVNDSDTTDVEEFVRCLARALATAAWQTKEASSSVRAFKTVWYDSPVLAEQLMQSEDIIDRLSPWTLNALFVSLLRALGIPSRLVTAYNISERPSPAGAIDVLLIKDSLAGPGNCLRYHEVWVEVWMHSAKLTTTECEWHVLTIDCEQNTCADGVANVTVFGPAPRQAIQHSLQINADTGWFISKLACSEQNYWALSADSTRMQCVGSDKRTIAVLLASSDGARAEDLSSWYTSKSFSQATFLLNKEIGGHQLLSNLSDEALLGSNDMLNVKIVMDNTTSNTFGEDVTFQWKVFERAKKEFPVGVQSIVTAHTSNGDLIATISTVKQELKTVGNDQESTHTFQHGVSSSELCHLASPVFILQILVHLISDQHLQQQMNFSEIVLQPLKLEGYLAISNQYVIPSLHLQNQSKQHLTGVSLWLAPANGKPERLNLSTLPPNAKLSVTAPLSADQLASCGSVEVSAVICCDEMSPIEVTVGNEDQASITSGPDTTADRLVCALNDVVITASTTENDRTPLLKDVLVVRRSSVFLIELSCRSALDLSSASGKLSVNLSAMSPFCPDLHIPVSHEENDAAPTAWLKGPPSTRSASETTHSQDCPSTPQPLHVHHIAVRLSADTPVGFFGVWLQLTEERNGQRDVHLFRHPQKLAILFNPFNRADKAFIEKDLRDAYLLTESGVIWLSSGNQSVAWPWHFNQFDGKCLSAGLGFIHTLPDDARRHPLQFAKALAGCLMKMRENNRECLSVTPLQEEGKKNCSGIKSSQWNSTADLLMHLVRRPPSSFPTQEGPVAALLVSFLRSFGVASRLVTCYDGCLKPCNLPHTDIFWSEKDLEECSQPTGVRQSEVWVEFWSFDDCTEISGWHALQAQADPSPAGRAASLLAISSGLSLGRDEAYFTNKLNSDVRHWLLKGSSPPELLLRLRSQARLVTSSANDPLDIVDVSMPRRCLSSIALDSSTASACSQSEFSLNDMLCSSPSPTELVLEVKSEDGGVLGKPFTINCTLTNHNRHHAMDCKVRVTIQTVNEGGQIHRTVKTFDEQFTVQIGKVSSFNVTVSALEYGRRLTSSFTIRGVVVVQWCKSPKGRLAPGTLPKSQRLHDASTLFRIHTSYLKPPTLKLQLPDSLVIGELVRLKISFVNPLPFRLRNARLSVCCPKLTMIAIYQLVGTVRKNEPVQATVELQPRTAGVHLIAANFTSDQLRGIVGMATAIAEEPTST